MMEELLRTVLGIVVLAGMAGCYLVAWLPLLLLGFALKSERNKLWRRPLSN